MKKIMFFMATLVLLTPKPAFSADTIVIPEENIFEVIFTIDGVQYSAIVEKSDGLAEKGTLNKLQKGKDLYFNLPFQAGTYKCLPPKGRIIFKSINTDLKKRTIPQSLPYISENDVMYIQGFPVIILEINCYPENE